jgi:hypothetical protein
MIKRLLEILLVKKWMDRRKARKSAGPTVRPQASDFPRYPN